MQTLFEDRESEFFDACYDAEDKTWYVNHYFKDAAGHLRRETICDLMTEAEAWLMVALFNRSKFRRDRSDGHSVPDKLRV